jgi:hypothetical protein
MYEISRCSIVLRVFDSGAGIRKDFSVSDFQNRFVSPLEIMMKTTFPEVVGFVVVSNGNPQYGLGEAMDSYGETLTTRAIHEAFPNQCKSGYIRTVVDRNWGNNAGSAHALNCGWRLAVKENCSTHILSWNPELQMTGHLLTQGFTHLERHNLDFLGFYRQGYWEKPQWAVAQNTACLYCVPFLESVDGFADECDGNDGRTIIVPEFGKVPFAGMDDFNLALRFKKQFGRTPRWGMVGRTRPFLWNIDFVPGTEREMMLKIKIARQYAVMQEWVQLYFQEMSFRTVMDDFFAHRHED